MMQQWLRKMLSHVWHALHQRGLVSDVKCMDTWTEPECMIRPPSTPVASCTAGTTCGVSCCAGLSLCPHEGTCVLDCSTASATTSVSGNITREDARPELNFSSMPNAVLVGSGGFLLFNNVRIADFASTADYEYTSSQPYINRGVGYGLWPTIALAPGALVSQKPCETVKSSCLHKCALHSVPSTAP